MDSAPSMETGIPEPGKGDTVAALFERATGLHARSPLIFFDDGSSLSYAEALSFAHRVAGGLRAMGVARGDKVVSVSAASAEAALVFWGCMLAGAVFVTIDRTTETEKLARAIGKVGPRAVFTGPEYAGWAGTIGFKAVSYQPLPDSACHVGAEPFASWLRAAPDSYDKRPVAPGDDAAIIFTSGTTGEPRGVVLSHGALAGSGRLMTEAYGWGPQDRLLSAGDFHSMSGLRNPLVAVLCAGASFIVAPHAVRANAPACSELMERLGATILCTVPAFLVQFNLFNEKIAKGFTERLRFVMSAGTPLPDAVARAFETLYRRPVLDYYGLTETAGLCVGVLPGTQDGYRGTIGVPVGAQVRIIGEEGTEAAIGVAGELLIRSGNLMSRYYLDPEATEEAFIDGWYRTRDLCRRRSDGSIELLGRVDDAFKDLRGELTYPYEIEMALERTALVLEAAVCGFVGEDGRPGAAAFVVTRGEGADKGALESELKKSVLARLGPYRTPTIFRFVDALPRCTNGKILRRKLRESLL
jgi:acyl-coenzyme A synthetase/AMP-(fatty) acid ligase